jgi:hypothetical protein
MAFGVTKSDVVEAAYHGSASPDPSTGYSSDANNAATDK